MAANVVNGQPGWWSFVKVHDQTCYGGRNEGPKADKRPLQLRMHLYFISYQQQSCAYFSSPVHFFIQNSEQYDLNVIPLAPNSPKDPPNTGVDILPPIQELFTDAICQYEETLP